MRIVYKKGMLFLTLYTIFIKFSIAFQKISSLYTVSMFEMCNMPMFGQTGGLQNGKVKHYYYAP